MKIQKFEDVIAWQKAQDLAVVVYAEFNMLKDWNFKNQIQDASVSVSNNIAEGFDRGSKADFRRFLYIALGSCSEVKSMIYLAQRLKYISLENGTGLLALVTAVSKMINGLITYLHSAIRNEQTKESKK